MIRMVCTWMALLLTGAVMSGCSWFSDTTAATPEVRLVLDREYQPAIGGGFHWRVETSPGFPEGAGSLTLLAGEQVVGGSQGGLPSDIYVGWLDWESLKFYYPDPHFPGDSVAVRLIMGFPDTPNGSASGWVECPEGEIVVHAGDVVFSQDGQSAALLEFNVGAERFNGRPRLDGKMQLRESPAASVFERSNALSIQYSAEPVVIDPWKLKELPTPPEIVTKP